ncbi:MAG: porphobilinogen synthase [Actinomycetota bacterium]|nr:porphobilinogen synthase [Actinomycetota bacterium]
MSFPSSRPRRLRRSEALRNLVAGTALAVDDLVAPLFIREGISEPEGVSSMPGVLQHTLSSLVEEVEELMALGIRAVILFGVPEAKDPTGSEARSPDGIVQRALYQLRSKFGDSLVLIADLCLDEFTDHGHCGVIGEDGGVDNDPTLMLYGEIAIAQARAGVHMVAPSGMMDGQVAAVRSALDSDGHQEVGILAYSAKYASALYAPFRDAAQVRIASSETVCDRSTYQQDPRNAREALVEVALDVEEGADIIMVKPAIAYLDVIAAIREAVNVPVAAFQVSGEYAMIQAGALAGWIDGPAVMLEQVTAIKRAGAGIVLTYFAKDLARAIARSTT